jgi:hypothetical protein
MRLWSGDMILSGGTAWMSLINSSASARIVRHSFPRSAVQANSAGSISGPVLIEEKRAMTWSNIGRARLPIR